MLVLCTLYENWRIKRCPNWTPEHFKSGTAASSAPLRRYYYENPLHASITWSEQMGLNHRHECWNASALHCWAMFRYAFSDRTAVIRISNNLFPRGICNPYAPLVPIARRFYQLYADLFINVCNIYSYPRSTQTVLRRYVIICLYGKVRMERIGYLQFVRYHNSICKCAFVCTLFKISIIFYWHVTQCVVL